jgi:hypothetical protein
MLQAGEGPSVIPVATDCFCRSMNVRHEHPWEQFAAW